MKILPFRNMLPRRVGSPLQGVEGGAGKVEISIFLRAPRNGSGSVEFQDVGRGTASGVVEEFKNGEGLKFDRF